MYYLLSLVIFLLCDPSPLSPHALRDCMIISFLSELLHEYLIVSNSLLFYIHIWYLAHPLSPFPLVPTLSAAVDLLFSVRNFRFFTIYCPFSSDSSCLLPPLLRNSRGAVFLRVKYCFFFLAFFLFLVPPVVLTVPFLPRAGFRCLVIPCYSSLPFALH